ncbi:hypothetical protein QQ008_25750 [Fulvivirgaceae bacterium BMA10]|uniref:Uncharacterized protein n=1 Tax=Splendidivirga corallicola TaxID=3051826 RepID=A0ABT8KVQ4_9BACT|nr:hypothetical protein [Fulvivirgaceae bacterium BMA10]
MRKVVVSFLLGTIALFQLNQLKAQSFELNTAQKHFNNTNFSPINYKISTLDLENYSEDPIFKNANELAAYRASINQAYIRRDWGIGLRLGDPTGINLKRYLGGNALEFNLGRVFNDGFSLFGHYLFQNPLEPEGLEWYFGFGAQLKTFDNNRFENQDEFDFGGDAIIGLEYTFSDVPISVFVDAILFVELIDDPFNLDLDAGIGARYNF